MDDIHVTVSGIRLRFDRVADYTNYWRNDSHGITLERQNGAYQAELTSKKKTAYSQWTTTPGEAVADLLATIPIPIPMSQGGTESFVCVVNDVEYLFQHDRGAWWRNAEHGIYVVANNGQYRASMGRPGDDGRHSAWRGSFEKAVADLLAANRTVMYVGVDHKFGPVSDNEWYDSVHDY